MRTQVANAISGNYCQPRCDEPTTEVLFQSGTQGKISLIISPLTKVTRLIEPSIDQARRKGGQSPLPTHMMMRTGKRQRRAAGCFGAGGNA